MRFRFLKTIAIVAAIMGAGVSLGLYLWGNAQVTKAIIGSGAISLVNVIVGCMALEYGIDKSARTFMLAVFGGMGVRMAGILIIFAALLLNGFEKLSLSLSLMGFYVVFMVAEIYYVVKELNKRSAIATRDRIAARKSSSMRRRTTSEFRATEQKIY